MGVEHYLVSSTLMGVVAQRLVRKICPDCKETYPVPDDMRVVVGPEVQTLTRGTGCPECMNTGYKGRLAIFELLVIDDDIRDLILARASAREIREKAISLGMRTLYEDGILKVKKAITTVEEVLRVTQVEA
jgi:type II secretory ATPase GspE/PulE/Tfp pilus assembly ATPase PilB-like protein